MKRSLILTMMSLAVLVPLDVEAQRNRTRPNQRNDARPSRQIDRAVPVSGRLIECAAPRHARSYRCTAGDARHTVVYRYNNRRAPAVRWRSVNWGHVRLGSTRHLRWDNTLNRRELRDFLGQRTVRRLTDHGHRIGLDGRIRGHWYETRRQGAVLNVTMGGQPLAEFIDFNYDGRIDDVSVRRARRW